MKEFMENNASSVNSRYLSPKQEGANTSLFSVNKKIIQDDKELMEKYKELNKLKKDKKWKENEKTKKLVKEKYKKFKELYKVIEKTKAIIEYGKKFIGVKYEWWKEGPVPKGSPMWAEDKGPIKTKEIKALNCAGLINVIMRKFNIKIPENKWGKGGTGSYYTYYKKLGYLKPFNRKQIYPEGTLIGRRFKDEKDQGHVAIIVNKNNKQYLLESNGYAKKTILRDTIDKSDKLTKESKLKRFGGGYYQYVVLPDKWIKEDKKLKKKFQTKNQK